MLEQLFTTLKARRQAARAAALEKRRQELLNSKPGVHPLPDDDPLFISREIMLIAISGLVLSMSAFYIQNFGAFTDTAAVRLAELMVTACQPSAARVCDFTVQWNAFVLAITILSVFAVAALIIVWEHIFTDRSDDDIIIDQQQQLDAIQQILIDMKKVIGTDGVDLPIKTFRLISNMKLDELHNKHAETK